MTRIELISAIVVVTRDTDDIAQTHRAYRPALAKLGRPLEFIYVVDGPMPRAVQALRALKAAGEPIEILSFATAFGEAAALTVGFRHAAGDVVFTLTPEVAGRAGSPAAHARGAGRHRSRGGPARCSRQPPRRRKFDQAVNALFGTSLHDIRCGVRAMRAEVAKELTIYGNQYRFLPLLAQAQGFAVRELDLPAVRSRQRRRSARWGSTPACCSTSSPSTSCSAS